MAEFLKGPRKNREAESGGVAAALANLGAKFAACLDPAGDIRHTASFENPAGLAEGSVEFAQALKLHVSAEAEKEKRAKVRESKDALMETMAAEFPNHIKFLGLASVESKEQTVQQIAPRHSTAGVPACPKNWQP